MPLFAENDFLPDYDALSDEVKEKAKLLYLNYPNNPTGGTATLAFLKRPFVLRRNTILSYHMILLMEQ